jgi:hypothetical protein
MLTAAVEGFVFEEFPQRGIVKTAAQGIEL